MLCPHSLGSGITSEGKRVLEPDAVADCNETSGHGRATDT